MTSSRIQKTGIENIDELIEAGIGLIDILPDIWAKAVVHQFKYDREQARTQSAFKAEKIGIAQIYFQQYLAIVDKISNQKWWQEARFYICDQINRYAFDNPVGATWDAYAKSNGADKNKNANILLFILNEYKKDLNYDITKRNYNEKIIQDKLQKIQNIAESIKSFTTKDAVSNSNEIQAYEERIKTATFLKQTCFNLIDATEKKWHGYSRLPTLRPVLLIIISNIYAIMLRKAEESLKTSIPGKLFSDNNQQKNLKLLIVEMKREMEKLAEVMLWQEQLYQMTQPSDLVLQFTSELHKTLSPYLNKKEYHCVKIDCREALWNNIDIDLADLLLKYSANCQQVGMLEYINYLPKENTLNGLSKCRCEFILQYGSDQAKMLVNKILYEKSSEHKAAQLTDLIIDAPSCHSNLKNLIDNYLRDSCQMTMLSRSYMLELENILKPQEILDRFPKIKSVFEEKLIGEVAEQISILQTLYLKITDANAWCKALKMSEIANNNLYNQFIKYLIDHVQQQAKKAQESKDILKESKILIQHYLLDNHQFDVVKMAHIKQEQKCQKDSYHLEIIMLYDLYQRLNSKIVWMKVLNEKLCAQGKLSQNYFELLNRLIWHVENTELRIECRKHLQVCQQKFHAVALQQSQHEVYSLAEKYNHLDGFASHPHRFMRKQKIKKEIAEVVANKSLK